MVSTQKKKTAKEVFSQLGRAATDFMIGHFKCGIQIGKRNNATDKGSSSDIMTDPYQVNNPQVDVHTL